MTETQEQVTIMQWAAIKENQTPELKLLYHVPNEGKRNPRTGGQLKAAGLKAGVPDLVLPVARMGYHGLYIELKKDRKARLSANQKKWLNSLAGEDYACFVAYGSGAAITLIANYLGIKPGIEIPEIDAENWEQC